MEINEQQQKDLAKLIEQGVDKSTERLAQMTHTHWEMSTLSLSTATGDKIHTLVTPASQEHYGAYFSAPGSAFIAMFPGDSGRRVARAFTKDSGERMKTMTDLDKKAIAEVSNILVNAVAGLIADTIDSTLIISAPQVLEGTKNNLLAQAMERSKVQDGFVLMSYVSMSSADLSTDCILVILLNANMLERLLQAIEI